MSSKKILSKLKIKTIFFPALLIFIVVFISWQNYEPGTILSGWDTLHPEFNFSLYLRRAFFGAWQEHQGLGAPAVQAHAAELPRLLIVYLLSLVLPLSAVRYVFFFLCLGIGTFGVYYFARYLLARTKNRFVNAASFLASLFYLLNLTTLQHFYVPLEMFAVHFAILPWLFLLATRYLRERSKKILIYFSLVTVFGAPMAHTATLFYIYLAALVVYVLPQLKRGIVLIGLTLVLNAYWLLPNLYYIKNHAQDVSNSKIHRIFTGEAFLQSKAFGDVKDLVLQKNFLFNWREFDFSKGTFVDLLDEWKIHLAKPGVKTIGYSLFALAILGMAVIVFEKAKYALTLLPLFFVSIFFWINANPPFEAVFNYLRENFSLFKEGLRFPFTKFSILLIMTLSVFFAYSSQFILTKLSRFKLSFIFFILVASSLVYFSWPMFRGNLISSSMKVKIPKEYFEVFEWFKNQDPAARVAKLPLQTFWGWNFYSWDYQGAGFTWFGISQPTLDREFDRWSPYNEAFYNQAAFALYSGNRLAFERVLQKYQVKYLLLDESVINAGGSKKTLFIDEIKKMFEESVHIWPVKNLDFLTVYETDFTKGDKFVWVPEQYAKINADLTYSQYDPIYRKYGNYIEFENWELKIGNSPKAIGYPFVNFDPRGPVKIGLRSTDNGLQRLVFENEAQEAKVMLPVDEKINADLTKSEVRNCDLKKLGRVEKKFGADGVIYKAFDNAVACDFIVFPDLKHGNAYVLRIKGENKQGRTLKIYLQNWKTNRMDLEELLPKGKFDEYFVVLPSKEESLATSYMLPATGYTLNLETRSFGRIASENVIESIKIYPIDIEFFYSLRKGGKPEKIKNHLQVKSVKKFGTWAYKVETIGEGLLVLGQGYEKGWMAVQVQSSKFKVQNLEHVKVNSWANGWLIVNSNSQLPATGYLLLIFYWPQLLEYLGFGVFLVLIAWGLTRRN